MSERVSIIIPTWNKKDLLLECLRSLDAQSFRDFDVIVVDDCSTDGSGEAVSAAHPKSRIVKLERNKGFCAAVNAGLGLAGGELVLLLNNDMTLEDDFLERLVDAADGSDAGMFAPLILWRDEPDRIYSAGDRILINGRPEGIGHGCLLDAFSFPNEIFGVCAGAGLYRREIFDCVGMLDETFEAYFEDSDLSFRARLAGFSAELVPEAAAFHVGSASIEGRAWWRTKQCYRNHALLVLKNMPARLFRKNIVRIIAERRHQTRRLFSAGRCEFGAVKAVLLLFGAFASLLIRMPMALYKRRHIQSSRVIDDSGLENLLTKSG